jgi:ABC-type bacteriocin/lantibiotic exporter with double-glycine peptidase domain
VATTLGGARDSDPVDWLFVESAIPFDDLQALPTRSIKTLPGLEDPHGHHGHAGEHHDHPTPFKRLLGMLRPDMRDLRVVIFFSIFIGLLTLTIPLAVEGLVNSVSFGTQVQPVVVLSLMLFLGLGFAAVLQTIQTWVVEIMQRRVLLRMSADLSWRLPRVRIDAFDHHHGPELVNRFFDILTVQKVGAGLLLDGVAIVVQATVGIIVLALYHPLLFTFDIVLMVAIAFIVFVLGRGAIRSSIRESIAKYEIAGWLEEIARTPMTFKVNGGPDFALERSDTLAREYLSARQEHFRILMRQIVSALALQVLASTALLGIGGWLVISGALSLGQLVAANLIVNIVVGSVAKLGKHIEGFYDLMSACDKLGHLIDLPLEDQTGESHSFQVGPGKITFRKVSYDYHHGHAGHGGHGALHGIDFVAEPGERIAIYGPSGAGKSTMASLLFGLREPTTGVIELDGLALRELRRDVLRNQVAVVKDFEIFDGTVLDNVRMGRPIPLAAVREALDDVGMMDEIMALPEGLQSKLQISGTPLTSGQARRLMLARALCGRPRVLVLDQTLDNLDRKAWKAIKASMFGERRSFTLICMTINDKIMEACDRILDLDHGHAHAHADHDAVDGNDHPAGQAAGEHRTH